MRTYVEHGKASRTSDAPRTSLRCGLQHVPDVLCYIARPPSLVGTSDRAALSGTLSVSSGFDTTWPDRTRSSCPCRFDATSGRISAIDIPGCISLNAVSTISRKAPSLMDVARSAGATGSYNSAVSGTPIASATLDRLSTLIDLFAPVRNLCSAESLPNAASDTLRIVSSSTASIRSRMRRLISSWSIDMPA
jgi:hypothetical protein